MPRRLVLAAYAAVLIAMTAASPADAQGQRGQSQDLSIAAFFGTFAGSGATTGADASIVGVTPRDLDVKIEPSGNGGFTATWTTVLQVGGPRGEVRRRTATQSFVPAGRPHQFRATDSGDPVKGEMLSWARIRRTTLYIYEMTVLEDGRYDMQVYARTLTGNGMQLAYTRSRDGEQRRAVNARLVKTAR